MSDMDNEETRTTQKLYNPANIEETIKKCDTDIPFEYSERDLIKQALEFYKRKDKILGLATRLKERRDKLRQIVAIDMEPHYWYKEQYALETLDYILGKEKKIEREREEER